MTFIFLCFSMSIGSASAQQSNLIVKLKSGSTYQTNTSSLKTITFASGYTNLLLQDWSTQQFTTSDVQNMRFQIVTDNATITGKNISLNVYPNPTHGIIYFKSLDTSTNQLTVYNINGTAVYSASLHSTVSSLDLSFLQQGVYILKINNTQTRLIKL